MPLALPSNVQKFFDELYKKVNYQVIDIGDIMSYLFNHEKDSNPKYKSEFHRILENYGFMMLMFIGVFLTIFFLLMLVKFLQKFQCARTM